MRFYQTQASVKGLQKMRLRKTLEATYVREVGAVNRAAQFVVVVGAVVTQDEFETLSLR